MTVVTVVTVVAVVPVENRLLRRQVAAVPMGVSFSLPEWLVDITSGQAAHLVGAQEGAAKPRVPSNVDLHATFMRSSLNETFTR